MSYTKTEEVITATETRSKTFRRLEDWIGNKFESSYSKTPEFMAFAQMYRARIRKIADKAGLEIVDWSTGGHFCVSAMLKNRQTGKFVYMSCSDVRHWRDGWYKDILVRTAEHKEDWTGGSNNSSTLEKLGEAFERLTR